MTCNKSLQLDSCIQNNHSAAKHKCSYSSYNVSLKILSQFKKKTIRVYFNNTQCNASNIHFHGEVNRVDG